VGRIVGPMLASAATPKPKLSMTKNTMHYPCSEGTDTFTVKSFPATATVTLRLGAAKAPEVTSFRTGSTGTGTVAVAFRTYWPGSYTVYASDTTAKVTAHAVLKVAGYCP
jgi:hypothetical protein